MDVAGGQVDRCQHRPGRVLGPGLRLSCAGREPGATWCRGRPLRPRSGSPRSLHRAYPHARDPRPTRPRPRTARCSTATGPPIRGARGRPGRRVQERSCTGRRTTRSLRRRGARWRGGPELDLAAAATRVAYVAERGRRCLGATASDWSARRSREAAPAASTSRRELDRPGARHAAGPRDLTCRSAAGWTTPSSSRARPTTRLYRKRPAVATTRRGRCVLAEAAWFHRDRSTATATARRLEPPPRCWSRPPTGRRYDLVRGAAGRSARAQRSRSSVTGPSLTERRPACRRRTRPRSTWAPSRSSSAQNASYTRLADVAGRGRLPGRSAALAGVAVQRELADHQHRRGRRRRPTARRAAAAGPRPCGRSRRSRRGRRRG